MLITHDMGVIAETADRIAVMYAGRLIEVGPTRAMLTQPAHPYTRGLMASIPKMQRISGDLPQIEGNMPRLSAVPAGCAFHPRCPVRLARCDHDRPILTAERATAAACWLTAARQDSATDVEAAGRA
jgi:peptide/nickel transport system ATP-binding protein